MPVYRLGPELVFPNPERAHSNGLLAIGGDLRPERLLLAYSSGIFPWPHDDYALFWHSPDPRYVLVPADLALPRSLRQSLRKGRYRLSLDTAFGEVIRACAEVPRPGQAGTWILDEIIEAYTALHRLGFAHSVEAWLDEPDGAAATSVVSSEPVRSRLVGGLYGVSLGAAFFGESMFARAPDASKVAFASFVAQLERWGFHFVDCQVHTEHLERFGAVYWPRRHFLRALREALQVPTRRGRWHFDEDPARAT